MTLYRLDASIRIDGSASRELADIVEREWTTANPEQPVIRRDIGINPLPADAWANAVNSSFAPESARTPAQKSATELAATLVDELVAADAILLAVPLYNFGVAHHVKAWIDLVITDPRAAPGAEPSVLHDKPVVLATVRGGAYGPGTPREGWDHSTSFLRRILVDVWGADLTAVEREFTLVGVNPALDGFKDLGKEMHEGALLAARTAGKALVSR